MDIETISIIIAAVAAIASAISAWFSKNSAKISRNALEYNQAPILILECGPIYFYIRNIGIGIAKSIQVECSIDGTKDRIDIPNILVPSQEPVDSKIGNSEIIIHSIDLDIKDKSKVGIILTYESLWNKKFISEIEVSKDNNNEYKAKLLKFYGNKIFK